MEVGEEGDQISSRPDLLFFFPCGTGLCQIVANPAAVSATVSIIPTRTGLCQIVANPAAVSATVSIIPTRTGLCQSVTSPAAMCV